MMTRMLLDQLRKLSRQAFFYQWFVVDGRIGMRRLCLSS
jgi:hypothetical protein